MVDWSLARNIARFAAGSAPVDELGLDLDRLVSSSAEAVSEYTGLAPPASVPPPEQIDRGEWAEINLETLAEFLDPVAGRLEARLRATGPFAGALRAAAGATLAAEAGLVTGYISQRILGQFEISLLQADSPTRLLFVIPNIERALTDTALDRDSFVGWVVLHEVTHVLQFSGVPWLRDYLESLLREYLATVEVRIDRGAAGGLPSLPDAAELVRSFREGGLAALVQTRAQRRLMGRLQAAMAVIEGYSEHVMDAVGAHVLPAYEGLREAMERRRRSRSAPERVLERLLGLDLKMRQYELGKRFCDAVVDEGAMPRLNEVWGSPAALPTLGELRHPQAWMRRLERERTAAA
jgi:coenzyme F420 biosynthesis associated uncharacterized protein